MKKFILAMIASIALSLLMTSCRPPELEGAFVHYNASRYDQAYELAQNAVAKYPANAEAWFLLGDLEGRRGNVDAMLESFDKSAGLSPDFKTKIDNEKRMYFGKYFNDGVAAYNNFIKIEDKAGDDGKKVAGSVVSNFQNATKIKQDYMANRLIAITYTNIEDGENALKYYEVAAEVRPDTALAWTELGFYYFQGQDYNKAADYFKKGLEVDPNYTEALTMYAQCLDFADRKEEAIAAYKNAINRNPDEKAIPFNLGLLLYKEANQEDVPDEKKKELMNEAASFFMQAHTLDPQIRDVYDLLGSIYINLERYDDAMNLLLTGVENFPESANIWYNLGVLYARTGDKVKSKDAFDKAEQFK
jgi:protein O-GlcNAc transferase